MCEVNLGSKTEERKEMELQAITSSLIDAVEQLGNVSRRTKVQCNFLVGIEHSVPPEKTEQDVSAAKPEGKPNVLNHLTSLNRKIRTYTEVIRDSVNRL